MSTGFGFARLKTIDSRTKDLINGYIRECQNDHELFGKRALENPYYNIPQLVNNHCVLFYETFTWYKQQFGKGLKFLSNNKVTLQQVDRWCWRTCMFENKISSSFCNKFNISFAIRSYGSSRSTPDFYIGYTTGETLESSIKNWQHQLGEKQNINTSCSWGFCGDALYYSGKGKEFCYVTRAGTIKYALHDILRLEIDFQAKKARMYYNDKEKDCRNMKVNTVWIGLSFANEGETVEMIQYKYD